MQKTPTETLVVEKNDLPIPTECITLSTTEIGFVFDKPILSGSTKYLIVQINQILHRFIFRSCQRSIFYAKSFGNIRM